MKAIRHKHKTGLRSGRIYRITLAAFAGLAATVLAELSYPFELPDGMVATLDVDTQNTTPFNNKLLGLNCNWPEAQYGKTGYNHPHAQKLIKTFKPAALRWPHGVWANFYDWETDGRRITDNYKTPYDESVKGHPDLKYGIDGLKALHDDLEFDVVFTWNVNYDSPEKGARRLIDNREKGFNVKWIELGNETFWKTQRSEAVSDVAKYIAVSKAHAAALKAIDSEIKVSVNATWREPLTSDWNKALAENDYYDAITLHKYIGHPDTTEGAGKTLRARHEMIETAETMQKVFPERPIWLTEWSVEGGENALSVIAMADTYLGLIDRPDLFDIASYFQINAKQPMILYDMASGIHTKTSYGAAYEIIRDTFQNSQLLQSAITSPPLAEGLDAVTAEVVIKAGKVNVLAVNKSIKPVRLKLNFDQEDDGRKFHHQALSFQSAKGFKTFALTESPLSEVASETREITLPPLSISRIDVLN